MSDLRLDHIECADALTYLRTLPDGCAAAVITDPPYGIGVDEWDAPIPIPEFVAECRRVAAPNAFLAFTCQMPPLLDWQIAARDAGWIYREHIAWIKRKTTTTMLPLNRGWESVLIYAQGNPALQTTKGRYEDVKLAGLAVGLFTVDGIDRYVKDLRAKLAGRASKINETTNVRHAARAYMNAVDVDRSPEYVNFTNVWSFLPENMASLNNRINHATVKPLKLMERLVELTTAPGQLVIDPFIGSGTTALACRNTSRHFAGCDMNPEYVELARARLAKPYTLPMPEGGAV